MGSSGKGCFGAEKCMLWASRKNRNRLSAKVEMPRIGNPVEASHGLLDRPFPARVFQCASGAAADALHVGFTHKAANVPLRSKCAIEYMFGPDTGRIVHIAVQAFQKSSVTPPASGKNAGQGHPPARKLI